MFKLDQKYQRKSFLSLRPVKVHIDTSQSIKNIKPKCILINRILP